MKRIAENSPASAVRFNEAVDRAARRIGEFPESGRIVNPALLLRSVSLPRWGYHLFYVDRGGDVFVLTVRSGRRRHLWEMPTEEDEE
jgi:plasmid stabilization system protein ParE